MEGYIYLQLLVIVISFAVCFASPPSSSCCGGGWVTAIGAPAAIAVAVVGRWYCAAVGASIAVIATVGAPTAVIVAVVGGWRPPLPLSSRWWWVGGAVPLLGPPLPSPSQVVGGWCPGTVVATVGSPAAVTSQVAGGTSHCRRCRCRDGGWVMPPDAIVTVVSSLWWSF